VLFALAFVIKATNLPANENHGEVKLLCYLFIY